MSDGQVFFVIGIGSENRELVGFLMTHRITNWAFLTAHNPFSSELTQEDNDRLQEFLFDRPRKDGYQFLMGYGESRHQEWPLEPSVLV